MWNTNMIHDQSGKALERRTQHVFILKARHITEKRFREKLLCSEDALDTGDSFLEWYMSVSYKNNDVHPLENKRFRSKTRSSSAL